MQVRFEDEIATLEQALLTEQNQRRDDLVARHQAEAMLSRLQSEINQWKEIFEGRRDRDRKYR